MILSVCFRFVGAATLHIVTHLIACTSTLRLLDSWFYTQTFKKGAMILSVWFRCVGASTFSRELSNTR